MFQGHHYLDTLWSGLDLNPNISLHSFNFITSLSCSYVFITQLLTFQSVFPREAAIAKILNLCFAFFFTIAILKWESAI